MSNIQILPMEESHFNAVLALMREFAVFERLEHKMTNTTERMKAERNCFEGLVALNDSGAIVGYMMYYPIYLSWSGKSLYLEDIYIQSPYRGHGIGEQFMQHFLNTAKSTGCKRVRWQVSEWNDPAVGFYTSLGATIDPYERNCEIML